MPRIVAFDLETYLMGPVQGPYPRAVCASFAEVVDRKVVTSLYSFADPKLEDVFRDLLGDEDVHLVGHNTQFDSICTVARLPNLIKGFFGKYQQLKVHCTQIQEKLLNLSDHGRLKSRRLTNGAVVEVKYRLTDLELRWLGVDRSSLKTGEDIWRLRYSELDGVPIEDYDEAASSYAMDDARNTLLVFLAQRRGAKAAPHLSLKTSEFQAYKHFCLGLMTAWGITTDQDEVAKCKEELTKALAPERMEPLFKSGILRRAVPPRPYKNGACDEHGHPLMTQGKKVSKDTKRLKELVERKCKRHGIAVVKTPTGQTSTGDEMLGALLPYSRVLDLYQHRQKLAKLLDSELPRLEGNAVIYPKYDPLKETGRTSSMADKNFPSCNIQNVPKKLEGIELRRCFKARDGHVLVACDYSSLELVSWAQVCWDLFGFSRLREVINDGKDPHAYQGSFIAKKRGIEGVEDYDTFMALKDTDRADVFDLYRTVAKPVGLGFPGGLGPATLVRGPARSYGLKMRVSEGEELREIWRSTYPEARLYFDHINQQCQDLQNSGEWEEDEVTGEWVAVKQAYQYESPLGMVRRGASYCAAANGKGLQTPSAEGAGFAMIALQEAVWIDQDSPLYGVCRVLAFIHDEFIVEIPEDDRMDERAKEISKLMVDSMAKIMQDVQVKAEPTIMRNWHKCKPTFDDQGHLTVTEK
jgi:DNA polymerase I